MIRFLRTTIDINDALLSELKELSILERRPLRVVLHETLQRGLGSNSGKSPSQKVKIEPLPVGVKAAYRGMSMNQFYDELESR